VEKEKEKEKKTLFTSSVHQEEKRSIKKKYIFSG
jgi:hypothetical protein